MATTAMTLIIQRKVFITIILENNYNSEIGFK